MRLHADVRKSAGGSVLVSIRDGDGAEAVAVEGDRTEAAERREEAKVSWATEHIRRLQAGETVQFRPRGRSMEPRIGDGWLCTVAPVSGPLEVGDVVLCRVAGAQYLHLVNAVGADGRVQIANNKGRINGWTRAVYGRLVEARP